MKNIQTNIIFCEPTLLQTAISAVSVGKVQIENRGSILMLTETETLGHLTPP